MTDRIRAVDCPSCGAPLELPAENQRLFKCNFCGTTLEDLTTPKEQQTGRLPKVIIHTRTIEQTPRRSLPTAKISPRAGCFILAIILGITLVSFGLPLLFSGASIFSGFLVLEQIESLRIYSFGPTQLLTSDNGTQPDVIGVTSNSDNTDRMIYVDFDAEKKLRWRSEPLGDGAIYIFNHIATSNTAIFMAYETTLVAFDRADGNILWQKEISDEVSNICQDCLQVFDAWVVTLTADGILSSYNAQNGELAWNVRLNETTRQLLNLNGNIGVLDKEANVVGINIYAPETSNRLQRVVPQCPNEIFPNSPQTLGVYDPVLASRDGKSIYVPISDYDPGCMQKWDTTTLAIRWESSMPRNVLDNFAWGSYLLTDEMLYLGYQNDLFAIDLRDGSYLTIYSDEDHNLIPVNEQNGLLLALAERTRGTRKDVLWGLDVATQSKLWEFDPVAEDVIEDHNHTVYTEGVWGTSNLAGTPIILEAFTNPAVVTFSTLDPLIGFVMAQNSLKVKDIDHPYSMQVIGWQGDQVYMVIETSLWWIDARTGTELAIWP